MARNRSPTFLTAFLTTVLTAASLGLLCSQEVAGQVRNDVCFPGEGQFVQLPPDPNFIPNVQRFTYNMFDKISSHEGERSVMLSPYSVWSVLSLAYFGALGNTQRELESVLGFVNKTHTLSNWNALRFFLEGGSGGATLNVANSGYFSNSLDLNRCLTSRLFDLQVVDFTKNEVARQAINRDVNTTTQGRISELITFLPQNTRFVLINAIFFKGMWETEFDPELTQPHEFLVPPGVSSGSVPMMNRVDSIVAGQAEGLDAMMVELPYKDSNVSMYLLLPNDPMAPTTTLTSRLNPTTFATAVRGLPKHKAYVQLTMPKFKLTARYEEELKQALSSLGVKSLFDPRRVDLTGFSVTSPPLFVDTAIHQATVEVNEEGTVAAAATALIDTLIDLQNP
ncbi:intracellular coagulation inhibitor 3-like isoform X2 [Portunus trituberculatus]|uniref:intracellular coagulation inhibitor 3-like isoform X2 n=1 Tax=Portunus trituberculatus TaxID=210409 RepID=UPI001E1CEFFB|nr:intracellular coagulation inhibitor 3-like isoform X2 [Portunus trituberculatus]